MPTNKSPLFSAEHRGEIAVIRIRTDLLADFDTVTLFYNEVIKAIGECSQIVFDLQEVRQLSSAVMGRFIQIWRHTQNSGGRIVFCRASLDVRAAFQTSRLDVLFDFASTLEEALAALTWTLAIRCPIAGCQGDGLCHEPSIPERGGELCCRSCGCQFRVAPFQLSRGGQAKAAVSRFELPTYEHELIRAELGAIVRLDIAGRFDLFVAEALVDACQSLPAPHCVLLDLRAATELSDAGLRLLGNYLLAEASGAGVVVLVEPNRSERTRTVLSYGFVSTTQDEALLVLRSSPASNETPAPLFVSVQSVKETVEQSRSRGAGMHAAEHRPSSSIP
jgi:anti-anti-sigma factor